MKHYSHQKVILRLKRARGHLDKVIAMMEAGDACTPTAQQLHAVIRALTSAKRTFVQDHIDHCITDVRSAEAEESLADLKEIAKYL
jgi:hypothetical protein NreA